MAFGKSLFHAIGRVSLVRQIAAGLALGIVIGSVSPQLGLAAGLFGSLFVGALKAVAPVLVFILVAATIAQHQKGNKAHIRPIIVLYLIGTFSAALTAVIAGMVFPTHIVLAGAGDVSAAPPSGIVEVLKSLLMNLVANPINAIANANYIGILAWALVLGAALRNHGSDVTRQVVADLAEAVSTVVKWIIRFAPLGIFGLVSSTIAETGFGALAGLCEAACGAVGLYGVYRAGGQSRHRVVENPPQPLSAGVYLPARKRRVCLLYPFFRRQYPREYGFGEKTGAARRHLFDFHPVGGDRQYGRRGDYDYRFGYGGGAHPRHTG